MTIQVENKKLPKDYRLVVTHFRKFPALPGYWVKEDVEKERKPLSKQGATEALIIDKNDKLVAEGWAVCGKRDNFCYRIGRDIAVGRAIKNFNKIAPKL